MNITRDITLELWEIVAENGIAPVLRSIAEEFEANLTNDLPAVANYDELGNVLRLDPADIPEFVRQLRQLAKFAENDKGH